MRGCGRFTMWWYRSCRCSLSRAPSFLRFHCDAVALPCVWICDPVPQCRTPSRVVL